jgi:hypothetical protein
MNKMVKSATLLFCGRRTLKKNGRLMTHHSGLTHSLRRVGLYPDRRVSSNDLTIKEIKKYKTEVIDKVTAQAT